MQIVMVKFYLVQIIIDTWKYVELLRLYKNIVTELSYSLRQCRVIVANNHTSNLITFNIIWVSSRQLRSEVEMKQQELLNYKYYRGPQIPNMMEMTNNMKDHLQIIQRPAAISSNQVMLTFLICNTFSFFFDLGCVNTVETSW